MEVFYKNYTFWWTDLLVFVCVEHEEINCGNVLVRRCNHSTPIIQMICADNSPIDWVVRHSTHTKLNRNSYDWTPEELNSVMGIVGGVLEVLISASWYLPLARSSHKRIAKRETVRDARGTTNENRNWQSSHSGNHNGPRSYVPVAVLVLRSFISRRNIFTCSVRHENTTHWTNSMETQIRLTRARKLNSNKYLRMALFATQSCLGW